MIACRWLSVDDYNLEDIDDELDRETRIRTQNCVKKQKAKEIVLGRFMLKRLVGQILQVSPLDVKIRQSSEGRPYLDSPGLFITSSHCCGVCIAVVSGEKVGCDLQSIRRFIGSPVKAFFSDTDFNYLKSCANPDYEMTRIWSIKEALYKYLGDEAGDSKEFWKSVSVSDKDKLLKKYDIRLIEEELEGMILIIISGKASENDRVEISEFCEVLSKA